MKNPGEVSKLYSGLSPDIMALCLFDCSRGRWKPESSTWQAKKWQVLGYYLIPTCKIMSFVAYVLCARFSLCPSWVLDFEFVGVKWSLVISGCIISRVNDYWTLRDRYLKWKSRHLGPGREMVCFSLSVIWAAAFILLWEELWRERRKHIIDDSYINLLSRQ